ncbi:MAG: hypothetical protein ABIW46_00055 [Acidimicrobiales bacterium]
MEDVPVGRQRPQPDDRILAPTRWTGAGIVPVLTAAFVILYLLPTRTEALWAWTIEPPLTPMIMGGGYLSGAYFFLRVARGRQWHRVGWAFLGTIAFTSLLGLATVLHWDRFNHSHVSFWAWLSLYVSTPVLLPWLWLNNRRTDPRRVEVGEVVIPATLRRAVGAGGALQLVFALSMFVRPAPFIDRWPWMLTPLTARTLAAFISFPAVTWLCFLFDGRWSSFRIPLETTTIGLALVGLAVALRADDLTSSSQTVALYLVLLGVTVTALVALQVAMARVGRGPGPGGRDE